MTEIKKKLPNEQGDNKEKIGNKNPPKEFQWKPGQSGNPKGRPKFSLVSILKELLQEVPEGKKEMKAKVLMREAIEKAMEGDTFMLRDIINRIDGMPRQGIDLGLGEEIDGIEVKIIKTKDEVKNSSDRSL